jgi:NAD(P)-dependent dehydrogenase (short-subunit alcohol dehydrogenase family)
MQRAVITGASRGLGLEFVRQLLARGARVAATCRDPEAARDLAALVAASDGRGAVVALDVTDAAAVPRAARAIAQHLDAVDLLVNNAGIGVVPGLAREASDGPLPAIDAEAMTAVLRTNAVGPALVTQALLAPLAAAGRSVVLNVTSGLGSLQGTRSPGDISYAMSKAALNMLTRKTALELAGQGTVVVSMDPGWVRTDMGGPSAALSPEQSIRGMLEVVGRLGPQDSGRFWEHSGRQMPW